MLLGKIIVVSGQILKNNFAVWSHWCWSMMNNFKWVSRMGNINVCPEVENVKPRPEEVVARGKWSSVAEQGVEPHERHEVNEDDLK